MVRNYCKACNHFVDGNQAIGTCRRYPLFQTRSPNEWCGEFSAIEYGDPQPEMLALPVVDMTPEEPKIKRKYTKRKVEA